MQTISLSFSVKTVRYYLMNGEKCLVANKYDPILCNNKFTIGGLVQPHWILKAYKWWQTASYLKESDQYFLVKIWRPRILTCYVLHFLEDFWSLKYFK